MTKEINPIQGLMDIYGSASKIATNLELNRQIVEGWMKRGRIPFRRGELIDEKTDGKVTKSQVWEWANRSFKTA